MGSCEEDPKVIASMRKEGMVPLISHKGIEFVSKEKAIEVRKERSLSEDFIQEIRREIQGLPVPEKHFLFKKKKKRFSFLYVSTIQDSFLR